MPSQVKKTAIDLRFLFDYNPLSLNGVRQVVKTWLLKEFGKLHFENAPEYAVDAAGLLLRIPATEGTGT